MSDEKPFWISWYHDDDFGGFELHSPWWVTGSRGSDDAVSLCAAVMAKDQTGATLKILTAYDKTPKHVEFRFCEEKPSGWAPFGDRFPRAEWMQWPTEGGEHVVFDY